MNSYIVRVNVSMVYKPNHDRMGNGMKKSMKEEKGGNVEWVEAILIEEFSIESFMIKLDEKRFPLPL